MNDVVIVVVYPTFTNGAEEYPAFGDSPSI